MQCAEEYLIHCRKNAFDFTLMFGTSLIQSKWFALPSPFKSESGPIFVSVAFQLIETFLVVERLLKKQQNYLAKIVMKGFIDFSGVFW
jgi:hypothetical protein